ncbi:hypothetical protein EJ04DRAFT_556830 [Polyplosphaeria fusca]|uniref:Sld7 C-terminal domain-containing protein n=1 Tax=Polyplosphaeria fusca TaxID=682080 RepID=A0A9P4UXP2_9PLEO|nr:hypothetical protein EJ04DRAFT_556830 [Polyplosphaeria fusca]
MTDVWTGDILLHGDAVIKDICLTQTVASNTPFPAGPLRFLSTVDTARVPIYLATGSSLDVWTTCEDTEQWFGSILLSKAAAASNPELGQPWWACARSQSPVGILTQVVALDEAATDPRVTQILFYGTIAPPTGDALPTPPSSSPDQSHTHPQHLPELRVHALPLSSHLLFQTASVSPAPNANSSRLQPDAHFIPHQSRPAPVAPSSPKRKRDIFDKAAQLRKKARGKGGGGVSAAAARANDAAPAYTRRRSLSIDTNAAPPSDIRPVSANGTHTRPPSRALSRSPSISSDARPSSRKGLLDVHNRRSGLSHVATAPLQPEEPTVETRNKEALSKVVMSAMRMHGLQQRRKNKSRRGSSTNHADRETLREETAEDIAKDEEYKLLYHQTYKGAALALRRHMSSKPLHSQPDLLRDVVEKLLAIFLVDPLSESLSKAHSTLLSTPGHERKEYFPGSSHSHASPFDAPSGKRVPSKMSQHHVHTGSPSSKKASIGD